MKNIDDNIIKWNNRALTYDKSKRSKFFKTIQSKAVDILDLKHNMTFLDLGCGTGWAVMYAYKKTNGQGTYIGIDISEKMIDIAQEKFKDQQAIKFIQGSAENIDLSLNSVDKIICTNSFHHYTDPSVVLASIKKVLKTNGIFCIADITKDSLRIKFLNKLLKKTEKGHVSFYSSNQYKEMFQKVGLKYRATQNLNSILKIHICEKI
jgi:ubiquinone/menaquinone biosynthesis C-methylase UbiE